jgi:hypothetical protein
LKPSNLVRPIFLVNFGIVGIRHSLGLDHRDGRAGLSSARR